MKKREESFTFIVDEYKALMVFAATAMYFIPPEDRLEVIEKMGDSMVKEIFKAQKVYLEETIPYVGGGLLSMLLRGEQKKGEPLKEMTLPEEEKQ